MTTLPEVGISRGQCDESGHVIIFTQRIAVAERIDAPTFCKTGVSVISMWQFNYVVKMGLPCVE